jgi:hypothetical protein
MRYKVKFWNRKDNTNFINQKLRFYKPCPCGCDNRENTKETKLIGYWLSGLMFGYGITILKYNNLKL